MQPEIRLVLGGVLVVVGVLMVAFSRWKIWRSRWFMLGGMLGHREVDEKTARFATRFWGAMTFLAGLILMVLSYRGRA